MTVSLHQTADFTRLDIAFRGVEGEGPIEGYIVSTEYGDTLVYTPFTLDGLPLAIDPISNPLEAAVLVIDNFAEREVAAIDAQIEALRASEATATGLMLRALPRRIETLLAYRERVLLGGVN